MNAEQMELARRFAACKGWVWLPGMQAVGVAAFGRHDTRSAHRIVGTFDGIPCATESVKVTRSGLRTRSVAVDAALPDLSDALTRTGLLEVVRRALDMPNLTPIIGADGWYLHGIPDDRPELWWSSGQPSELHALLAALEAAPGV